MEVSHGADLLYVFDLAFDADLVSIFGPSVDKFARRSIKILDDSRASMTISRR